MCALYIVISKSENKIGVHKIIITSYTSMNTVLTAKLISYKQKSGIPMKVDFTNPCSHKK